MKEEVGKFVYSYGPEAAINRFKSKYAQYAFVYTTINNSKRKFANQKENVPSPKFHDPGRPNIFRDDLLQKMKIVVIGVQSSGAVISRKMVIFIVERVSKANDPITLSEFGGTITSTDNWAGGILQSIDWLQRKGTTGKVEPSAHLLVPEKFTFQKVI